jgi:TonB family protein
MSFYILFSGLFHLLVFGVIFALTGPIAVKKPKPQSYIIDFIGSGVTAEIQAERPEDMQKPVEEKKETEKKENKKPKTRPADKDELLLAKRPSILDEELKIAKEKNEEPLAIFGETEKGISAEFPNFPYPWYITQVRMSLWNRWSSRMPKEGSLSSVVVFRIQRSGEISGLNVERSSGNKLFDFAAMSSVERSTPFPPLPDEYGEQELVMHVEFKIIN